MEEKTLTFEEKLSKLLELAKSKKNVLDEKEVLDAFAGEELTPEKLDRIYDFLDKKHVDVLKMSNDDDMDPDLFSEDEGDIAVRKRFFCDRSLCDDLSLCDELGYGIRILRGEGDGSLMFL